MPKRKGRYIVIYADYLSRCSGLTTAVFELMKGLSKENTLCLVFSDGREWESLFKCSRYGEVRKYEEGKELTCDVCIIAGNFKLPKGIKAGKYIQWVHSDYGKYGVELVFNEEVSTYIAVSKHVAESFSSEFGGVIGEREVKVIYNLLDCDYYWKREKELVLVTNSRISMEKGFGRMLQLAQKFKDYAIPFVWYVYGSGEWAYKGRVLEEFSGIREVMFMGYSENVERGLGIADYLVQLSDFEGCPYSVLEALKFNVPCIVSNWEGVEELITDGVNGYILPMNIEKLKLADIKKIVKKIPEDFICNTGSVEEWVEVMGGSI